jgi:hypothetical protein
VLPVSLDCLFLIARPVHCVAGIFELSILEKKPATQWTGWAIKNRQSKDTGNTMDRTGNQE